MRAFWPVSVLMLCAAGALGFAPVRDAWLRAEAGSDPLAHVELDLDRVFTPARVAQELEAALAAEDEDLADSLIALAVERGVAVDPAQRARVDSLHAADAARSARRFASGFLNGAGDSDAALGGAITADVTGFGDIRDLAAEGRKALAGQETDMLVVGLAAAGLALTAATVTSLGAAMPARNGLTLVKLAQKGGQISKPLAAALTRSVAGALDREALQASARAAARFELGAARTAAGQVLRPAATAELRALGEQASTIAKRSGWRGLKQTTATAENAAEMRQAARLAAVKGTKTRAVLKVMGRGALVVASLSFSVFGWIAALLFYLFSLAIFARRVGASIGRRLTRHARKKQERRALFANRRRIAQRRDGRVGRIRSLRKIEEAGFAADESCA